MYGFSSPCDIRRRKKNLFISGGPSPYNDQHILGRINVLYGGPVASLHFLVQTLSRILLIPVVNKTLKRLKIHYEFD